MTTTTYDSDERERARLAMLDMERAVHASIQQREEERYGLTAAGVLELGPTVPTSVVVQLAPREAGVEWGGRRWRLAR